MGAGSVLVGRDKAPAVHRPDLDAAPLVHHRVGRGRGNRRLQIRSFEEVHACDGVSAVDERPLVTPLALTLLAMNRGVNAQAAVMAAEDASSSAWASHVAMSSHVSALWPGWWAESLA